jgi:hypothetical protein
MCSLSVENAKNLESHPTNSQIMAKDASWFGKCMVCFVIHLKRRIEAKY